ncbi:hypothetical protein SULI_00795 [Saccharolobus solfataricus]|uniref:Uncharacterized protein n=3 Tax=Saccharolobus solfataricus TaxID=2287 RepID=Q97W85_SACS2|nr:hypothetical protein [Saccharolobus solfataricus]AAK42503.1 Hypothetical protein SSO10258 [Saccharolobus solfataricus P2]AKA72601.1 hypothetical protein SULB_0157 [Saccharolobus solfataricus]AKA75300.1 hypothetical protein SULC_0156 [Saccharolobus solfataricus]AKA77993.1 hypothetical protein SULA_0156 [Saccharolobus solfataricus]AZF67112.1 hypothetical protein SULG_00795 [Saccharolobus solfataricus]
MIVVVKYRIIDKNIRGIINSLRKIPFIKEILFYSGEKNSIFANGYMIWEEGSDLNPIEEVYDVKIIELSRRLYFPICG